MKQIENKIMATYSYYDGFYIEITKEDAQTIGTWLCHTDYGVKKFMIGFDMADVTPEEAANIAEQSAQNYIDFFEV